MARFKIEIKTLGNHAILIEWPNRIDEDILDDIIRFTPLVLEKEKSDLINHNPGYHSLLLQYDAAFDFEDKKEMLLGLYKKSSKDGRQEFKVWHIPVCYDEAFGIDLPLFTNKGLSTKELIRWHTSKLMRVYMIGFLPGFIYLGGLPDVLHMKRKENPRSQVQKGSVAIGGEQTGIYPMDSPGGWQIIGRTPLSLFDIHLQNPTPIRQGDAIQFYSIDMKTYEILSAHK